MRILCYGDSNTWGKSPDDGQRFSETVRWPKRLESLLRQTYPTAEIIEEGLRSRTIHLDDPEPGKAGRNGFTLLQPILESHNPIDWLIIALGTNDCKSLYDVSADEIALSLEDYFPVIKQFSWTANNKPPRVLIMAPPVIKETQVTKEYWRGAEEKTTQRGPLLHAVAEKYQAEFVNLTEYITPGAADGVHFDADGHRQVAEVLAEVVTTN